MPKLSVEFMRNLYSKKPELTEKIRGGMVNISDWHPPTGFKLDEGGQVNPWVTLYAMLAKRYRDQIIHS